MLARLPESQQEVIRLKFQHQMSYREISRITGQSESNVGFLIHRGIKSIREMLS
jgi:RNA polymerase sigma-70 factor (ECF subfamily)